MTALAITAALVLPLAGVLVWGMRGRAERRVCSGCGRRL